VNWSNLCHYSSGLSRYSPFVFLNHLYKHLSPICFLTNNETLISETLPCYARFACHIASSTDEEAAAKAAAATADTGGPTM
jgi:hypothetical protein